MTSTASPPREVSLYLTFMSRPVSRMVLMALSRLTLWLPFPDSAGRAASMALTLAMALRSMQGICTSPPAGSGVIESPAKVHEMWLLEAQAHHAEGGCFVLTHHPLISGRPSKAAALERLIEDVRALDGMWIALLGEIARRAADTVEEVRRIRRVECPARYFDRTGRPVAAPSGGH
jgi:hypothetical protein